MIWYQVEAEDYVEVYRIHYIPKHKYISKYEGKNIEYALLLLFTDKNILEEDINKYLIYILNIINHNYKINY